MLAPCAGVVCERKGTTSNCPDVCKKSKIDAAHREGKRGVATEHMMRTEYFMM